MSDNHDVIDSFMSTLTNAKSKDGRYKLWRFNIAKLEANMAEVAKLPNQARHCVKACYDLSKGNVDANYAFTVPMIVDQLVANGFKANQPIERIVRYYMPNMSKLVLDPVNK